MTPETPILSIREQIADRLRADILSGELVEGQQLKEEPLRERFGVSRGPIRDVFLQLTQEGLLVSQANKGVKVGSRPDPEIQPLIIELRQTIEVYALERIFPLLDDKFLLTLEKHVDALKAACLSKNLAEIAKHDMAFHRSIIQKTGDEDLIGIWLPIVVRMMLHYTRHEDMRESYLEHEKILEAICSQDLEKAAEMLKENIQ